VRRFAVALLIVATIAAAGFAAWGPAGGGPEAVPYRTAAVDRAAITAGVRATGSLSPVSTVLVSSQLSGLVVEILVDHNSPVKTGQLLARLFSDQIRTRRDAARADLEQARADLAMRRAAVDRSRATRLKAESTLQDWRAQRDRVAAQLAESRRTLERQTELTTRNVGSQTALDSARTGAEVLKAGLASAEANIASAQAEQRGLDADTALAEANVQAAGAVILGREAKLKDIEIDLARTAIRSPVDGVVVKREVELGQTVAASLAAPTLFTIAQDLRAIDIHANVDEADVGRLKPGQGVTFSVNAYPNRAFEGTVRTVRLGAQTIQNVVTYTAVVGVENADLALLPGMTANLQIVTDERDDALRVPNAALRFRPAGATPAPSGPAPVVAAEVRPAGRGREGARDDRARAAKAGQPGRVFVLGSDGQPQEVALRLGITDGGFTEVVSGDLPEGAAVITGGGPRPPGAAPQPEAGPRRPRMF
jgi:HlyD family secretion protein